MTSNIIFLIIACIIIGYTIEHIRELLGIKCKKRGGKKGELIMLLEVKDGIKIIVHNKDRAMGCHYPEDDWDIEAIAPTYEEAIELIIPKYVESVIYPSGNYISDVKYVTYNDKQCVVDDTDRTLFMHKDKNVINDIKQHPLFERLSEEKYQKAEALLREKIRKQKIENEKSERKLLKKLKKKYDK